MWVTLLHFGSPDTVKTPGGVRHVSQSYKLLSVEPAAVPEDRLVESYGAAWCRRSLLLIAARKRELLPRPFGSFGPDRSGGHSCVLKEASSVTFRGLQPNWIPFGPWSIRGPLPEPCPLRRISKLNALRARRVHENYSETLGINATNQKRTSCSSNCANPALDELARALDGGLVSDVSHSAV